jgi:hypothetical protein
MTCHIHTVSFPSHKQDCKLCDEVQAFSKAFFISRMPYGFTVHGVIDFMTDGKLRRSPRLIAERLQMLNIAKFRSLTPDFTQTKPQMLQMRI